MLLKNLFLKLQPLFDTGADSNCILEGLIPTKYFEKTSEQISTANGSKLKINYKLSTTTIENQNLKVETPFLLVKNLKNKVILGTPFIRSLFPLQINNEGIITQHLGQPIIFRFIRKPIIRDLNPIHYKQNQINFLKEEISFKNIDHQVQQPKTKERVQTLLEQIQSTICSDIPNAFWERKQHIVDLPYEKDFQEKLMQK